MQVSRFGVRLRQGVVCLALPFAIVPFGVAAGAAVEIPDRQLGSGDAADPEAQPRWALRPARQAGSRVYARSRLVRDRLEEAVRGAATRLGQPGCAAVVSAFRDQSGEPLGRRLAGLGLTPAEYLQLVVFVDGNDQRRCQDRGVVAVTAPGSRVVHVCREFGFQHARNPARGEALIIHEMLHSLGLAENPPSSDEITDRVLERCAALDRSDRASVRRGASLRWSHAIAGVPG